MRFLRGVELLVSVDCLWRGLFYFFGGGLSWVFDFFLYLVGGNTISFIYKTSRIST